jgi:hypothetical protein
MIEPTPTKQPEPLLESCLLELERGLEHVLGLVRLTLLTLRGQQPGEPGAQPLRRETVHVEHLQLVAGALCGVSREDLLGKGRSTTVVRCRQLAMLVARWRLRMSYPEIGVAFGRDHTTVMSDCRAIVKRLADDPALRRIYALLMTETVPSDPLRKVASDA